MLYLDSSAVVKLYIREQGSPEVDQLTKRGADRLFTSVVTKAEVLSTFARSRRDGRLGAHAHELAKRAFLSNWMTWNVVEVYEKLLAPLEGLMDRHALRGSDAIHLCTALLVGAPDFACFDNRLRAAAAAEGLRVLPHLTATT
jgi:predicted nucleic acid-binding protein